jgi:hypothetical protein
LLCLLRSGHFKAVINKPQNVFVMRDVACASYVAGCNTMFFGHQPGLQIGTRYDAARARSQIMRRLSFADEMGAKYHSCLSFAVSGMEYESGSLDTVMSVTTRLLPWEVNTSNTHDSFPGGEAMFREYNRVLNLKQIHYGEDVRAAENMEFISQVSTFTQTLAMPIASAKIRTFGAMVACVVDREQQTTRSASWDLTESFPASRGRTLSSSPDRDTLAPTRFQG